MSPKLQRVPGERTQSEYIQIFYRADHELQRDHITKFQRSRVLKLQKKLVYLRVVILKADLSFQFWCLDLIRLLVFFGFGHPSAKSFAGEKILPANFSHKNNAKNRHATAPCLSGGGAQERRTTTAISKDSRQYTQCVWHAPPCFTTSKPSSFCPKTDPSAKPSEKTSRASAESPRTGGHWG